MSETICIKTFATREEAGFAKSLLESHGIKAMVSADDCGGMRPYLAFASGGVKLFVLEENVKLAMTLLGKAGPGVTAKHPDSTGQWGQSFS